MVVLKIVTVCFDMPIPQVHFMKLISCSLYNSWHTLKREGSAELGNKKREKSVSIPPGHYTLEGLAKVINSLFNKYNYQQLEAEINTLGAMLKINNFGAKPITLDRDLADVFGINQVLKLITNVKLLRYPTTYFIHCDLIDRNQNFFNNKRSDLLAKLNVKGKAYEKVSYHASPQQPFRDCLTGSHANSITLSIRDQDGEFFYFNGTPIEFELEIN